MIEQGWQRASKCDNSGGSCVEVNRDVPGQVLVRDSKDPSGPVLAFTGTEWADFVAGVKDGEFGK